MVIVDLTSELLMLTTLGRLDLNFFLASDDKFVPSTELRKNALMKVHIVIVAVPSIY